MVTINELTKKFIQAEMEGNFFNFEYEGIPIWWFARDKVFYTIFKKMSDIDMNKPSADTLSIKQVCIKTYDSLHINKFTKKDILVVSTSLARREKVDGRDYDIFFDFLSETAFANDYAVLETPDNRMHSKNPYSKYRYYGDKLIILGNLNRKLAKLSSKFYVNQYLYEYCQHVHGKMLNITPALEIDELYQIILKEYLFARSSIGTAENYLNEIKPKVILVECGYGPSRMAIQYAAKRQGIPVIELQHGLIIPDGIEYFFGATDKKLMKNAPLPDVIAVYGPHFKRILLRNPFFNESMIKVVGCPYLWEKVKIQSPGKKNNNVLITSQPGYTEFYINLALELSKRIDNIITIKTHPNENITQKLKMKIKDINIVSSNRPLYEFLKESDIHISAGSTSHLEAMLFGLKDIIVSNNAFDCHFSFLVDMGVPTASSVEEVEEAIKKYPMIDDAYSYVQNQVYAININPLLEVESLIKEYIS